MPTLAAHTLIHAGAYTSANVLIELGQILASYRTEADQEEDNSGASHYGAANMALLNSGPLALWIATNEWTACKRSGKVTKCHIYRFTTNQE